MGRAVAPQEALSGKKNVCVWVMLINDTSFLGGCLHPGTRGFLENTERYTIHLHTTHINAWVRRCRRDSCCCGFEGRRHARMPWCFGCCVLEASKKWLHGNIRTAPRSSQNSMKEDSFNKSSTTNLQNLARAWALTLNTDHSDATHVLKILKVQHNQAFVKSLHIICTPFPGGLNVVDFKPCQTACLTQFEEFTQQ